MYIPRLFYEEKILNSHTNVPIIVLTGARQVGKTTLLKSLDFGNNTNFLLGQDPEAAELFSKKSIINNYLIRTFGNEKKGTLIIDEFQYIPGISVMLKMLADENADMRFVCSGSSSLEIMSKIHESMTGRVRIIPVSPLSFSEYLLFNDKEIFEKYLSYQINDDPVIIEKSIPLLLNEYLVYGGLPKVALEKNYKEKENLLTDIYQTYLLHDIRSFIKNQDFIGFNRVLKLLAVQTGNLLNINNLAKTARISYIKCEEIIDLLRQMFIISLLPPFSKNKTKEISKMQKIFFNDNGLRNIIYNNFNKVEDRIDGGILFENYVYNEIKHYYSRPDNICFYRSKAGLEIDFIIEKGEEIIPVEVKFSYMNKLSKSKNLMTFQTHYTYSKSYLINKNLSVFSGQIRFVPGYFCGKLEMNSV